VEGSRVVDARTRRELALESLQERGELSVATLSRTTGVSEMTIRRDLEALEREGLLRRVHGGAVRVAPRGYEPPYALRAVREPEAKRQIGELAAELVSEGDTIVIDMGTTTLELARALRDATRLTIVTPSLRAAELLLPNPALRVIVTGGIARHGELSLIGELSERAFAALNSDVVFLGAAGVSAREGVTDFHLDEVRVKRAALASARRCVVLAHAAKLGEVALAPVCPLERVDVLVTDAGAPEETLAEIRECGVDVMRP
jgi:DeoR/GlpR family transcriptional regulator of sugar metabolism